MDSARPCSAFSSALKSQMSQVGYLFLPHSFFSPSTGSGRAVVSCWQKYVHEVPVNDLEGLSLPRKKWG